MNCLNRTRHNIRQILRIGFTNLHHDGRSMKWNRLVSDERSYSVFVQKAAVHFYASALDSPFANSHYSEIAQMVLDQEGRWIRGFGS